MGSDRTSATALAPAAPPAPWRRRTSPAPPRVGSRFRTMAPARGQRLPSHVMWGITLVTAVGMALLNFFTIFTIQFLVDLKFNALQDAIDRFGPAVAVFTLVGICSSFALIGMSLIFGLAPDAGGSGSPENRGWLNGSAMHGFFTVRNLIVRCLATILSNASGYPVGREGPTVTMGSNLAYLVTQVLAKSHMQQWVDLSSDAPARVVDEEQLGHARRVVCAVGGACGMAMIFNAPIGGFLYMFEEMTSAHWPLELTFRSFVGLMVCTILSQFLLNLCHTSIRAFIIYEWQPQQNSWGWVDVPGVVVVSAVLGLVAALHTRACLALQVCRQRFHKRLAAWQPHAKMAEAVLYAALCACVVAVVSLLEPCDDRHRQQMDVVVSMTRYNCEPQTYNPLASLLITTADGAVKRLFSVETRGDITLTSLLVAFVAYTLLNIGLTGIPVPSGNFTGTMMIGAIAGRLGGGLIRTMPGPLWAEPAIYAMCGAAAMLCSFKQMTMAVVAFIIESGNDLSVAPLVMLSITVSLSLSRLITERGYDEEQVLRKGVEYLEPEMPRCLDRATAEDLRERLPPEAVLPERASPEALLRALAEKAVADFPVVRRAEAGAGRASGLRCIGFTTRKRLAAALRASGRPLDEAGAWAAADADAGAAVGVAALLPVWRLAEPPAFLIPEGTRAPRFYTMFSQAGAQVACIVSSQGEFLGVLSRRGLVEGARRWAQRCEDEDDDDPSSDGSSQGSGSEGLSPRLDPDEANTPG